MIEVNTVMRHYKNEKVYQIQSLTNTTATNDQFKPTAVYFDINEPTQLWSRPVSEIEEKFTVLPHCTELAKLGLLLPSHSTLIPVYNIPQIEALLGACKELHGTLNERLEEDLLTLISDIREVLSKPQVGFGLSWNTPFPFAISFNSTWDDSTVFTTNEVRDTFNALISEKSHLVQRDNKMTLRGSFTAV